MRRCFACLLAAVVAMPASAARSRGAGEELLRVATPVSKSVANAHPHVNVIVSFGAARDGTPVEPATFRARLNGRDVTDLFRPVLTGGVQTGVRAALPENALRHVDRPRNKLRLSAQAKRGGKGGRPRDVDRVRFGVADDANQAPTAMVTAGAEVVRVGEPIAFDAAGSHDPDEDELTFSWTFSDGGTATGPAVMHAFASASGPTVAASVEVSDGVTASPAGVTLPVALSPDPGRTPGLLRITASGPLEFSAVAIGASATRTLTLHNDDPTPTSQVKIEMALDGAEFAAAPPGPMDLGPGASVPLQVSFSPTATGHADARLTFVTSAANRSSINFVAHGYGGSAPGDGPTGAAIPVFGVIGSEITRLAPEGGAVAIDNTVGSCGLAAGGAGTGDACVDDGDCDTSGEVCVPSNLPLDATSVCADGRSLFVLSEDSYVDLRADPDTELSGTLVRFDLDAGGATTAKEVLYRTTEETTRVACDGFFAGDGGLAYLAEFRVVAETSNCDRDERDALVSVNKGTGNARTVPNFSRIDEAANVPECDFRDPVERLEVAPDGVKKYVGFESKGLWRIAPTPQPFSPDVHDLFGVHPDSSVATVVGQDRGTTGTIDLYRLTEAQVEHGALPLSALTPCASYAVPNNTTAAAPTRTIPTSIIVVPATLSGRDATALVTFRARGTLPLNDVLPPFGEVMGTVAFSLPADGAGCSLVGLISLQAGDLAK
jgi:hypothetical protein